MRPCNQCRRPVENDVLICELCETWNEAHGSDSRRAQAESETSSSETDADYSYAILMGTFSLVITGLFALIGMAIYGIDGFLLGGAIGLVVGIVLFSVSIKM